MSAGLGGNPYPKLGWLLSVLLLISLNNQVLGPKSPQERSKFQQESNKILQGSLWDFLESLWDFLESLWDFLESLWGISC